MDPKKKLLLEYGAGEGEGRKRREKGEAVKEGRGDGTGKVCALHPEEGSLLQAGCCPGQPILRGAPEL